jgi:hypothetical protein
LLYFGAMIALLAMTWFYSAHFDSSESLLITTIYALIFFGAGIYFWQLKKLRVGNS